jgi:hypothetical protein
MNLLPETALIALLSASGDAVSGAEDCSVMIITLIFWYSMSFVAGIPKALLFPASLMFLLLCDVLVCLMLLASFQLLKPLLLLAFLLLVRDVFGMSDDAGVFSVVKNGYCY